jgi:hypothetical protein
VQQRMVRQRPGGRHRQGLRGAPAGSADAGWTASPAKARASA